jgi:ethanolamine utilization protein EutA
MNDAMREIEPQMLTFGFAVTPRIAHETDGDHFHDVEDYDVDHDPSYDGLYQADNVNLTSVGIDIGSSGTQIVFSRIKLQRLSDRLSSRYYVVSREQLFQSPVTLTPYSKNLLIDAEALSAILDTAYRQAGMTPQAVDTGAVILTGEALRRENAEAIAIIAALRGGQLVSTMAGHHLEAVLAAYGSGAAWASNELKKNILNIDIGGGTTKFAIVENGRVLETAALHVGGRLHVFDEKGALTRLEPAGQTLADEAGLEWRLGGITTAQQRDWLATAMAEHIAAATTHAMSGEARRLLLTEPLAHLDNVQGVMFSGGVSEYVYGRESRDFHDMGKLLGEKLANMAANGRLPWPLLPAGAGIRATALGLSEYAVQLSGNTTYVSHAEEVLPLRNLRVARPDCALGGDIKPQDVALAVASVRQKYELDRNTAYAFHWHGVPSYARISAFAEGLALAFADIANEPSPLVIVLDGDIARTLGRILREEFHVTAPLLILDGILLNDFDFIDLGRMRKPSNTVPVTIKSLLFAKDPRNQLSQKHEIAITKENHA